MQLYRLFQLIDRVVFRVLEKSTRGQVDPRLVVFEKHIGSQVEEITSLLLRRRL